MAAILGISVEHLGRLAKSGDLPPAIERGKWDVADTVQSFVSYKVGAVRPGEASDAKSEELLLIIERRRKTAADAEGRERQNAYEAGRLIELEQAETVIFEDRRGARDAWMAWPGRFAPLIAADLDIDGAKLAEALKPYVHQQLEELGEPDLDFTDADQD